MAATNTDYSKAQVVTITNATDKALAFQFYRVNNWCKIDGVSDANPDGCSVSILADDSEEIAYYASLNNLGGLVVEIFNADATELKKEVVIGGLTVSMDDVPAADDGGEG